MIAAGLVGGEPHGVVMARHHIVLDAQRGDEEAVDHVFGRQRDLHWPAYGNVQFVDLALAARILELPHPLLAHHVNIHRVGRGNGVQKEDLGAPPEEGEHHQEGDDGPGDFQPQRAVDGLRNFIAAAPVLDRKDEDHAEDEHRHHHAHQRQVDIQVIDVDGDRGSGFRPKWKLHRLSRPPGVQVRVPVSPEHDEHEASQRQDRRRAKHSRDLRDRHSVFSGRRIVVIAEQQHLVGG